MAAHGPPKEGWPPPRAVQDRAESVKSWDAGDTIPPDGSFDWFVDRTGQVRLTLEVSAGCGCAQSVIHFPLATLREFLVGGNLALEKANANRRAYEDNRGGEAA